MRVRFKVDPIHLDFFDGVIRLNIKYNVFNVNYYKELVRI